MLNGQATAESREPGTALAVTEGMRIPNTSALVVSLGVLVSLGSTPALAQSRVPAEGMWAVGGSFGATAPQEGSFQNGLDLTGNVEGYLTRRLSIRAQTGVSWWDIQGRGFSGTITPFFVDGNLVYNWEGGAVHPYVTGGLGVYHFHASEGTVLTGADTRPGFDVGGGIEYFFNRHTTMTGELTYHNVGAFSSPLTTFNDGSFWRFGLGAKVYLR
jgi:hypothetical protein